MIKNSEERTIKIGTCILQGSKSSANEFCQYVYGFCGFSHYLLSVVSVLSSESIQLTMNIENILVSRFIWLGIFG